VFPASSGLPCIRCFDAQSDRDILEHIVYDFGDHEMMEALRPSIEEAQPIHSQQLALDYIGKRASQVGLGLILGVTGWFV
jgi:DNA-directed RNA polymerase II subunit RPB2